MWTQIVGKTLLACSPPQNHWWHTALRVSARGLASPAPIVAGDRCFDIELDLVAHVLAIRGDGRSRTMSLAPRTVRSFYEEYMGLLKELGVAARIWTTPVEIPDPIPLDEDEVHHEYDAEAAHTFFHALRSSDAVLKSLANGYVGKQSPVQFFWGSFDLAATRFSGRRAPERPGSDRVTREAYSHEVISFGFWPGGTAQNGASVDEAIFYAYAAPEPPGFARAALAPAAARYDEALGEFVLPYEAVRTSPSPARTLAEFCESAYAAGAALGGWNREELERHAAHAPGP
jgi:hypothetical protein